jgi:hypothetical protein
MGADVPKVLVDRALDIERKRMEEKCRKLQKGVADGDKPDTLP